MRPSTATQMLVEFHTALDDEPGRGNAFLRMTLHKEEHGELIEALEECECFEHGGEQERYDETRERLARELADVLYIAYETAHAFNIDLDAALREVHRAAMSKVDPATMVVREDGKILKPPGFVPPDMTAAVGSDHFPMVTRSGTAALGGGR